MEQVDVLAPPDFAKTGQVKPLPDALKDGDWVGTFNLWIVRSNPVPAIVYQQRPNDAGWMPGKLDVSAGGHYEAGEDVWGGMREAEEELGKAYAKDDVLYLGRRLNVTRDTNQIERHYVVEVLITIDNSPLSTYVLQPDEVPAIYVCPIDDLLQAHMQPGYSFRAEGIDRTGGEVSIDVTSDSFPPNWDNYHFKMALMAKRYLDGERPLLY